MTKQKEKILMSVNYLKENFPKKFNPKIAVISEKNFGVEKNFKILGGVDYKKVPPHFECTKVINPGKILFARSGNIDLIIFCGRLHFFDGFSMREVGHFIYVLKFLGIHTILGIEEMGLLNPRFKCGEIALVYDHINLMGDNPLIGENDAKLGLRFPDMSDAYNKETYGRILKIIQDKKLKLNEAVYLGTIGPESETEAEVRFYRDIGSDVTGYSLVPENIAAIHGNLKYCAIGLLTRELIADKMMEDNRTERQKETNKKENLKKSIAILNKTIKEITENI
jgi:purine-nucleoside phosphorylase